MHMECLNVNDKGHLTIGGCDTVELMKEYGSPLYIMDESSIRGACRKFRDSIEKYYGGNGMMLYASKAFSCKEIYRVIDSEGCGADLVSGGELYTALKAGFPMEKAFFHGNSKTRDELVLALNSKVGRIVVDNIEELTLLNDIAGELNVTQDVHLRIKPGVDAHTHNFILTGKIDSKFGFALETGEAMQAVKAVSECGNLSLKGLHCHIGSQIFDTSPFVHTSEVMFSFMDKIRGDLGITIAELNLGGGFGIKYIDSDDPKPFESYMDKVSTTLKALCQKTNFPMPKVFIEPGRSITATAGITLYTVRAVKEIPGIRNYILIDGGMTDNPRYALYQCDYDAVIANKAALECDYTATIGGRCCESGDLIQENVKMQKPVAGDICAVFCTGAYNYSMASNYNRVPKLPTIFVNNGQSRVVIKRETYDDLIKNDV